EADAHLRRAAHRDGVADLRADGHAGERHRVAACGHERHAGHLPGGRTAREGELDVQLDGGASPDQPPAAAHHRPGGALAAGGRPGAPAATAAATRPAPRDAASDGVAWISVAPANVTDAASSSGTSSGAAIADSVAAGTGADFPATTSAMSSRGSRPPMSAAS